MIYKRACVTGGAGFIGSHLVRRLIGAGMEVTVIDNLSVGRPSNVHPSADLVIADILDEKRCTAAIGGCDILFHLAARVAIRSSFDFVVEDAMTNVCGTAALLRAAKRSGTVRKVISTSSMAVYSDAPGPVPVAETHPTRPVSPYGISKLAAEQLTHSFCKAAGIDSVVLRLFNTYGPGQKLSPYVGVFTIFANKLRAGEEAVIFGDGEQARDFVHVSDIVSGFTSAMGAPVSGETFNIGTGQARTVNHLYAAIARTLGVSQPARHADAVPGELRYSIADIGKARRELGYEPAQNFDDCAASVVQDILAVGATC